MILSLIRHSETVVDPNQDPASWPLSERGLAAARELAAESRWKTLSRLVSSTEQKAISTGECLAAAAGVTPEMSPSLDEVYRPSFIEDYDTRVARFFHHPNDSGDDWETANQALNRARAFIEPLSREPLSREPLSREPLSREPLSREPAEGHIALVGHGMLWALARAWLLGNKTVDPTEWKAILMPDVNTWSVSPAGVVLVADFQGISGIQ